MAPRPHPEISSHAARTCQERGFESHLGPRISAGDGPSRPGFNKLLMLAQMSETTK